MSNVSFEALPLIVPFFGGAVLISLTVVCCGFRRFGRRLGYLEERVAMLEARPIQTTAPPMAPTQVYIPTYPPATIVPPPPYNYMAPRATAPPSATF